MNNDEMKKHDNASIDEDDANRIPTNLRTLLILETIGNSDIALTPTEINQNIGLPKQTIHRLCKTLVQEGFLVYEQQGSRLRPGRRLRKFSAGILQSSRYHILRHQVLTDIGKASGETVNFVMPEDEGMNYVDRVEADWPFRVQLPIGTHVPFHCTASGKVFLSSLRKKHQRTFVNSISWERRTPNTITDPEKLIEELRKISRQGYALDLEEFMEGMVAIAVPVIDSKGHFSGALAIHGPSVRLTRENLLASKDILINGAKRLQELTFELNDSQVE